MLAVVNAPPMDNNANGNVMDEARRKVLSSFKTGLGPSMGLRAEHDAIRITVNKRRGLGMEAVFKAVVSYPFSGLSKGIYLNSALGKSR